MHGKKIQLILIVTSRSYLSSYLATTIESYVWYLTNAENVRHAIFPIIQKRSKTSSLLDLGPKNMYVCMHHLPQYLQAFTRFIMKNRYNAISNVENVKINTPPFSGRDSNNRSSWPYFHNNGSWRCCCNGNASEIGKYRTLHVCLSSIPKRS